MQKRQKLVLFWDAGVAHVYDPENPTLVGKGRDEIHASGDLYIQMFGLEFVDRDEFVPLGNNIPGIQTILATEKEREKSVQMETSEQVLVLSGS